MKVLFPYEVVYEMIRINSMYSVGLGSVPSLLTDHLELQHNANFEQHKETVYIRDDSCS